MWHCGDLGFGSKRSSATVIYFVDDSFVSGLGSFAGPKLEELGDLQVTWK